MVPDELVDRLPAASVELGDLMATQIFLKMQDNVTDG
jgi:hypothetical protein